MILMRNYVKRFNSVGRFQFFLYIFSITEDFTRLPSLLYIWVSFQVFRPVFLPRISKNTESDFPSTQFFPIEKKTIGYRIPFRSLRDYIPTQFNENKEMKVHLQAIHGLLYSHLSLSHFDRINLHLMSFIGRILPSLYIVWLSLIFDPLSFLSPPSVMNRVLRTINS